jgi:hypothetical protein
MSGVPRFERRQATPTLRMAGTPVAPHTLQKACGSSLPASFERGNTLYSYAESSSHCYMECISDQMVVREYLKEREFLQKQHST